MRAINHTVTGAVIGAVITNPLIALPAALISHFVLDAIPHSGGGSHNTLYFKLELLTDAALSLAFLSVVLLLQPDQWQLIIACGILGAAPDLWWLPYWLLYDLKNKPRDMDPIGKLMGIIQWSESKPGYIVEAFWLIGALYAFFTLTA